MSRIRVSFSMNDSIAEERDFLNNLRCVIDTRKNQWLKDNLYRGWMSTEKPFAYRMERSVDYDDTKGSSFVKQININGDDSLEKEFYAMYLSKKMMHRGRWVRQLLLTGFNIFCIDLAKRSNTINSVSGIAETPKPLEVARKSHHGTFGNDKAKTTESKIQTVSVSKSVVNISTTDVSRPVELDHAETTPGIESIDLPIGQERMSENIGVENSEEIVQENKIQSVLPDSQHSESKKEKTESASHFALELEDSSLEKITKTSPPAPVKQFAKDLIKHLG